jgi:ketosteroid isomerase-like protein
LITKYYDACSAADVDTLLDVLHPEVVHWFLAPNIGSSPVRGNEHLARYWRKVSGMLSAVWLVDSIVQSEDRAVIEWTMYWMPAGSDHGSARVATRGAEWFDMVDGRIHEIRSYYHQQPFSTELDGFPYAQRGYSTVTQPWSALHRPPGS